MASLTIQVPDHLDTDQRRTIQKFFEDQTESDWIVFKRNFSAFISSLKRVCANFWHKICDWATDLWNRITGNY